MVDINLATNYKGTRKKRYDVYACVAPVGTKVNNFLENSDYVTQGENCIIISGTIGEQWVVSVKKFINTYSVGSYLISDVVLEKMTKQWVKVNPITTGSNLLYACFVPKKQQGIIQTSWGANLLINNPKVQHGLGDFVIASRLPNGYPNLQDRWVVNGLVFATTYNCQAFQGKVVKCVKQETVVPKGMPWFK